MSGKGVLRNVVASKYQSLDVSTSSSQTPTKRKFSSGFDSPPHCSEEDNCAIDITGAPLAKKPCAATVSVPKERSPPPVLGTITVTPPPVPSITVPIVKVSMAKLDDEHFYVSGLGVLELKYRMGSSLK